MQKCLIVLFLVLSFGATGLIAQGPPIYLHDYSGQTQATPCLYDPEISVDLEGADNFHGLADPITGVMFAGSFVNELNAPVTPNPSELVKVNFYEYTGQMISNIMDGPIVAPATGTYTVIMYDSWGDGWNGAYINLLVNGSIVLEGIDVSEAEGSEASYTFAAVEGDLITTTFSSGEYDDEISYDIYDPAMNLIGGEDPIPVGIGAIAEPIIAPLSGTYTVELIDTYGDGWNGGWLSVFVDGVIVLNRLTLVDGGISTPPYTFWADEFSEISCLYSPGEWAYENEYRIFDPDTNLIVHEGESNSTPHSIGPCEQLDPYDPDWLNPVHSFYLMAEVMPTGDTFVVPETVIEYPIYIINYPLPYPVIMESGWVSIQTIATESSANYFTWLASVPDDNICFWRDSWSKSSEKKRGNAKDYAPNTIRFLNDQLFALMGDEIGGIVVDQDGNTSTPGATVTSGGDVPPSLLGVDSGVPAVIYTVNMAGGTHDIIVMKPTQFPGDWYCWLQVGTELFEALNPIPGVVGSWTFEDVEFATKGDVVIIINDNSTLPVELSSFTAVLTGDMYVQIAWVAESETNHSGYNILRSESMDMAEAIKVNATLIEEGSSLGSQISYSFIDSEAYINMQYYYWLESVALDGVVSHYGPLTVTIGDPELDPVAPMIPKVTTLHNAFPNPFNPSTTIGYYMAEAGNVDIQIYNLRGQLMKSYTATHADQGTYYMSWDGRDTNGQPVGSGIYLYRMTSGNYSSTKKMVLSK